MILSLYYWQWTGRPKKTVLQFYTTSFCEHVPSSDFTIIGLKKKGI